MPLTLTPSPTVMVILMKFPLIVEALQTLYLTYLTPSFLGDKYNNYCNNRQ